MDELSPGTAGGCCVEDPGNFVADYAEVADPEEEYFKPLGNAIPDFNAVRRLLFLTLLITIR